MSTTTEGRCMVMVLLYLYGGDGWASFQELEAYQGRSFPCEILGEEVVITVSRFTLQDCYGVALCGLVEMSNNSFRLSFEGRRTIGYQLHQLVEQHSMAAPSSL